MKSKSKHKIASKIAALKVSFKSRLYVWFLLFLSSNAHNILSVEKNMATRTDKTIFRLLSISLSTQRILTIPTENRIGTIKILASCKGLPLNTLKWSKNILRISRKLLIFKEKPKIKITVPIVNKIADMIFKGTPPI